MRTTTHNPPHDTKKTSKGDGGYTALELVISMAVIVLAGALAVAIIAASTQSSAAIRNQTAASLQASQAIDTVTATLTNADIFSVTDARVIAFVNRPYRCFRYTYSIDWNSGTPALTQTIDARAVGATGRCSDLAPIMWTNPPVPADVSTTTTTLVTNLTPNSDGTAAFTYYSVGNSPLNAATLQTCDIARIAINLTVEDGNDGYATASGATALNQTALAMGGC